MSLLPHGQDRGSTVMRAERLHLRHTRVKKKKDIDSDEPMKDPGQNLYIHSLCEHLLTAYYMRAPS